MSDSSVDRSSLVSFFRIEEYFHSMHVRGHIDDKTMEYLNPEDYSFYPNGLAAWDTLKTVLMMATTG
jgi:hypothetical protein